MQKLSVGLLLLFVLSACDKQEPDKYLGPKDDPFTGRWSFSNDIIHFADAQFRYEGEQSAKNEIQLYQPLDRSKVKPQVDNDGKADLKRELLKGTFTVLSKDNIQRPNGKWTEVVVKINYTHSTCVGVEGRTIQKEETRKLRFFYTKNEGEYLFWGERSDQPEFATFIKYNDDDAEKKDSHKGLAKVKTLATGCYDKSGNFIVGRGLQPIQ